MARTSFRVCLVGPANERQQAWRDALERHGISVQCQTSLRLSPTAAGLSTACHSVVDDSDAQLSLVVLQSASDRELDPAFERGGDGQLERGFARQLDRAAGELLDHGLIVVREAAGDDRDDARGDGDFAGAQKPDATLALDATERELVQVCELVAQVVRLRRLSCAARIDAAKYRRLAELDPLTGIANRRAWEAELERAVADCSRRRVPLTVALFDLDEFKQINDHRGMVVGDRVLMEVARELAAASDSSFAQPAFVARLGGDEFIVMWVG
ncbi:MAG TPA: GGDEF domain-containing protein, partial [Pirellulaceae bacterium]|nr:GGDEF domain-containing protein [Pirellulaceae bacterium]